MKNYDLIIASGATICYNKLAKDFSAFKTGGKIDTMIMPNNLENMIICLNNLDCPIVFGGTTNSLISDNGLTGDVIVTTNVKGIDVDDEIITAMSGEPLTRVCNIAKENCLSGMEQLCGIPGTVGGAVCMNAGAFGRFISDILISCRVFKDGKVLTLTNEECGFGYRSSLFGKSDIVVLSATFKLMHSNGLLISNNMKAFKTKRKLTQPNDISLGSVFKKYENIGAGYYIENCGLKGVGIGGCKISEKHANFIVNCGGASSTDYAKLVNLCSEKVYEKYNIKLEREVKYFGEFIF